MKSYDPHIVSEMLLRDIEDKRFTIGRALGIDRRDCSTRMRFALAWALRTHGREKWSLPEIARAMGYRSHTSVISAAAKFEKSPDKAKVEAALQRVAAAIEATKDKPQHAGLSLVQRYEVEKIRGGAK